MSIRYGDIQKYMQDRRTYFADAKEEISRINLLSLHYTSLITAIVIFLFILLSKLLYSAWVPTAAHLSFLAAALLYYFAALAMSRRHCGNTVILVACWAFQVTVLAFVTVLDVCLYPALPALYMSAALTALHIVFTGRLTRVIPFYLAAETIYAVLLFRCKDGSIARSDLLRLCFSVIISLGVMLLIQQLRVRDYLLRNHYHAQSLTDPLTGTLNKLGCESAVMRSLRKGAAQQCILLVMDIDNFKYVNDQFGHAVGDAVLQEFGTLLKTTFRSSDIIGRIGGDEFMVLMLDTCEERILKRRYQHILSGLRETSCAHGYSVSVSAGAAILDGICPSFDYLFRFADDTLYEAKSFGKGSCVSHAVHAVPATEQNVLLIADDDVSTRALLHGIFENEHSAIIEAESGDTVLELINQYRHQIDVLLLDSALPGKTGLEILAYLKSRREFCDIPVVIVAADESMESRALQLGASDVVPQPIDPEITRIRVSNVMHKHKSTWFS